jgi:hypothetical protein
MLTAEQIEQVYAPELLQAEAALERARIGVLVAGENLKACERQLEALRRARTQALEPAHA